MTNIEQIMKNELDRENIKYHQEYPLRSGFVIDFAIIDRKIAIECDGEKWHSSRKAQKKDRFRDWMLRRAGWVTLRFKGKEIENNIELCLRQIKEVLFSEIIR